MQLNNDMISLPECTTSHLKEKEDVMRFISELLLRKYTKSYLTGEINRQETVTINRTHGFIP